MTLQRFMARPSWRQIGRTIKVCLLALNLGLGVISHGIFRNALFLGLFDELFLLTGKNVGGGLAAMYFFSFIAFFLLWLTVPYLRRQDSWLNKLVFYLFLLTLFTSSK